MLPENLRAATIALQGTEQVTLLSEWVWYEPIKRWGLQCRLSLSTADEEIIPSNTDWYVLVEEVYPHGTIKFYPAKAGSLTQTFPHQSFNGEGVKALPWRSGDLCLNTSVHILNRTGLDSEPFETYYRLHWHFLRALAWLEAGRRGDLAQTGDAFELPQFPIGTRDPRLIAFNEDHDTNAAWAAVTKRVGLVDLGVLPGASGVRFVKAFRSLHGEDIVVPHWGHMLTATPVVYVGLWLRLDACPALVPWQAPVTWGELRQITREQHIDLDRFLRAGAHSLRDGKMHYLLVGFPIPERLGEPAQHMHWMGIELPILSHGTQTHDGFRPNATGYWMRDRNQLLADAQRLGWQASENWTPGELAARGRLPETVIRKQIVLVGAGALGSALAELLVRTGVFDITIIDSDNLMAGNLVRHILTLSELMMSKAESLAARLNSASPHAQVTPVVASFPHLDEHTADRLRRADVVIDCTASDDVLVSLSRFRWPTKKQFISLSMGLFARRLFCFSVRSRYFLPDAFYNLIGPWLAEERQEFAGTELPREGIGCWHPVLPARADEVGMFAAVAIKFLERELTAVDEEAHLIVYEQISDDLGFAGVHRVIRGSNE